MKSLSLSKDLHLPLDIAGEALAIMANRGAGKSFTSAVMVEELYDAGVQFAVLDPTGVYWGLRAAANGKDAGLPVIVLGGAHGDVPLEPAAGKLIADLLVDTGQSMILDLSDFPTKGSQTRFVTDFAERLYRRKARSRSTLHLVIDEAHEFAPQKPMRDEARMLGAVESLIKGGRSRGLGATLITQRSATLNKNVLDLIDTMIAMRILSPRDRKAVEGWIAHHDAEDRRGVLDSLPSMKTGTAWVWSPVREILERVTIRRIRTFDSYATPKPGQQLAQPRKLADIDITALGEQIAATAERARENDPKELQTEIARLKKELVAARAAKPGPEIRRVEIPVITDKQIAALARIAEKAEITMRSAGNDAHMEFTRLAGIAMKFRDGNLQSHEKIQENSRKSTVKVGANPGQSSSHQIRQPGPAGPAAALPKGELAVLRVCGQYQDGANREQISILTGYKRSSRDTYIQRLSEKGFIVTSPGADVVISPAGLEALGPDFEPLPTGLELQQYWLQRLPTGEAAILRRVIEGYPDAVPRDSLSEATGYKRSSRDTYIQRLGARKLVSATLGGVVASRVLFDA